MTTGKIEGSSDTSHFDNATIGEGALIEPDVSVGFRYHPRCGPARIGKHCILRKGTVIYGDVTIGDHFHAAHYAVVRATVRMGNYCTLLNHSAIEGIARMGDGVSPHDKRLRPVPNMDRGLCLRRTWHDLPQRPVPVQARPDAGHHGARPSRTT